MNFRPESGMAPSGFDAEPSIWTAAPRVLPPYRSIMVIPAVTNIGAVGIAELDRLMFVHRYRKRASNSRIALKRIWIRDSVEAGRSASPEISVQRGPQTRLDVVAQVSLKSSDRAFRLGSYTRVVDIARKELGVCRKEPCCSICVYHPMSPAPRQTKFGFERPAIGAIIQELRGIVLSSWRNHAETNAYRGRLFPSTEIPQVHGRATDQVDREAK